MRRLRVVRRSMFAVLAVSAVLAAGCAGTQPKAPQAKPGAAAAGAKKSSRRGAASQSCSTTQPMGCTLTSSCTFPQVCCEEIVPGGGTPILYCGSGGLHCPGTWDQWGGDCSGPCAPVATSCLGIKGTACGWCTAANAAYVGTASGPNPGPGAPGNCGTWIWDHTDCP